MKRDVASQLISAQMINAADGSNQTTGTCSVAVEIDGVAGTGGTATHIVDGKWEYAPIQADTNGAYITFQFVITGAITGLIQLYTAFPQTGDNYLGSTAKANLIAQYDTTGITGDNFPATQIALGSLSSGSAAISTTAGSWVPAGAEGETNTYTSTFALDGIFHIVTPDGTSTDGYYEFLVGGSGVPVTFTWDGYANPGSSTYDIFAYNWAGAMWQQVGALDTKNDQNVKNRTFDLTLAHVGIGSDLGKVRCRILSSDGTAFGCDRILCSYAIVSQSVGYANGAVWGSIGSGTPGTEAFVNGVADNKSDTFSDMVTIADAVGLDRFEFTAASIVTLFATINSRELNGAGWTLALGGQDIDHMHVFGAAVSGISTAATECGFHACSFKTSSLQRAIVDNSAFRAGTTSLTESGDYEFDNCFEGDGTHIFSKTLGKTITGQWQDYHGNISFDGFEAGDDVTVSGVLGSIDLGSPASGAAFKILGTYEHILNPGSAIIDKEGAIKGSDIADTLLNTEEIGIAGVKLTNLGSMSTTMKEQVTVAAAIALTDADLATSNRVEMDANSSKLGTISVATETDIPDQISALKDISAADVLAAGDADGFSLEEALKLLLSASTGVLAGAATSSITIDAADGSKTRITATVDVDGNRSVVVRDATG